jgi:hypothetical protein
MAVLAAMPNANVNTTTRVKPGFLVSARTLARMLLTKFSIVRFLLAIIHNGSAPTASSL